MEERHDRSSEKKISKTLIILLFILCGCKSIAPETIDQPTRQPSTPEYSIDRWVENLQLANDLGYRIMNIADFAALGEMPEGKVLVLRHDIHYRDVRPQEADPHTGKNEVIMMAEIERHFVGSNASYYPMWNWYKNKQSYQDGYADLIRSLILDGFEVGIHHDNFSEALDETFGASFDSDIVYEVQCDGIIRAECAAKTYPRIDGSVVSPFTDWIGYSAIKDRAWDLFIQDVAEWESEFGDMRSSCGHGGQSSPMGVAFRNPSLLITSDIQDSGIETDCNRIEARKDALILGDAGGWGGSGSLSDALKSEKPVIYVNTHPYTWTHQIDFDCGVECRQFTHAANYITTSEPTSNALVGGRGTIQIEISGDAEFDLGKLSIHVSGGLVECSIGDSVYLSANIDPQESKISISWDCEQGASLFVGQDKRDSTDETWSAPEVQADIMMSGVVTVAGYRYKRPDAAITSGLTF